MNKFLISALFCMALFSLSAQDADLRLSLQEAIDFALTNNRNAKNATRAIDAAKKQKWETIAAGLPQIDAKINYQNFLKQQVSVVPAEFVGGNEGDFVELIFGTKQNMNATATLNQLIFDGSYLVGLQSTKVFLEISKKAKTKTDLEVRKAVINAYGNVLVTQESEDILSKNREVLQKNLNETSQIFENGLTDEESVEQLQITLSGIESALKNATRLKAIALQMFNITLGIDLNTNTILTERLEDLASKNIVLKAINAKSDVNENIDFQIAENDMFSKELMVKLEKSKSLPVLSAFLDGGYLGFANEFSFLDRDQRWNSFSTFGINLNVPIFSSFRRTSQTQRAKIELEIARDNLTELEQQLRLKIASAKSNYQFSIEDYHIKKDNLTLAERIEHKNEIKFFEGIGSSFELRQAQTQLYAAQNDYLQAMLNLINTKTELDTILNLPNN